MKLTMSWTELARQCYYAAIDPCCGQLSPVVEWVVSDGFPRKCDVASLHADYLQSCDDPLSESSANNASVEFHRKVRVRDPIDKRSQHHVPDDPEHGLHRHDVANRKWI